MTQLEILTAYRNYQEEILLDILSSTIQFFKYNEKGKPTPFGTGVLVKINEKYFVFSAAHVIDKKADDLWVPIGGDEFLCLGGLYLTNIHPDRERDDIDMGVIDLNELTVERLKETYIFLAEEEIQIDHIFVSNPQYIVTGYPVTKTKLNLLTKKMTSRPFKYITATGALNRYKRMKCDPNHRVLVHYDKSSTLNLKTGQTQKGPNSYGMSGCGLWHVSLEGFMKESGEKKLVAILTDWPNGNWWIGTKIEVFTEFVRQHYQLNFPVPQNLGVTFIK